MRLHGIEEYLASQHLRMLMNCSVKKDIKNKSLVRDVHLAETALLKCHSTLAMIKR